MSYQVGLFCYDTPVHAAQAVCAGYAPVSSLTSGGDAVKTVTCQGVNADTGALQLQVANSPTNSAPTTYTTVEQIPTFSECQHGAAVKGGLDIFFAFLGAILVPYALYKMLMAVIDWRNYRGSNE